MISSRIYTFLSVTLLFIGRLFLFPSVKLLSIIVPDCSTVYLISSLLFRLILYPSVNLRFVRLNIGSDKLWFFRLILCHMIAAPLGLSQNPTLQIPRA